LSLGGGRKLRGRWLPKDADSLDEGDRITDYEFARALAGKIGGVAGAVTSVTKKARKNPPPLPYSLPKLQIMAVIFFCSTGQAVDAPKVLVEVVTNRDFVADGLPGYENYHLHDVYELRKGLFGVVMLCPVGFQETIVYDTRNGQREAVYHDAVIPRKARREEIRQESILVADTVRLARTAVETADDGLR